MPAAEALAQKFGIAKGQRVIVRRCPDDLHDDFKALGAAFDRGTIAEVTLSFVRGKADVDNACKEALALTAPDGSLWMIYPTTEEIGWEPFADHGWQSVAEVAVDETWSALRFQPR